MCKIMALSGIKKDDKSQGIAWDFAIKMSEKMSKYDNDGFGYAAMTHDGKIFGERWLNNSDAFINRSDDGTKEMADLLGKESFGALIPKSKTVNHNTFGDVPVDFNQPIAAIIMHARKATCGKGMENTHPFYRDNTALIHNGVVTVSDTRKQVLSTCDSEVILTDYINHDIKNKPEDIQKLINELSGWYAVAVLSNKGNVPTLDIFRDGGSTNLNAAYIKELDATIISTLDNHIIDASNEMGFNNPIMMEVKKSMLLRINPLTGQPVCMKEFSTVERSNHGSGYGSNYSRYRNHSKQQIEDVLRELNINPAVGKIEQLTIDSNGKALHD